MPPATLPFHVSLDSISKEPLYKQLSDQIRNAILKGELAAGSFLPATRNLADELGISRFTVVESYRILTSQGYLEAGRGAGSRVSSQIPRVAVVDSDVVKAKEVSSFSNFQLSSYGERLLSIGSIIEDNPHTTTELNHGAAALDVLPVKQWRQALAKYAKATDSAVYNNWNDPQGHPPLRQAIAEYVARSRSVITSSDQVAVFSGYQPALECITRILVEPDDLVIVEKPGYVGVSRTLRYQGARIMPIPVDEQGMITSQLSQIKERPKLIFTTPSLQEPTGVALSLPRRLQLLQYAKSQNAFIIEDDYDSEYRYGSRPIPALQSLDDDGRVIYIYTFRRMLYPLVRLAFLVLPPSLVSVVKLAKISAERDLPMLEQCILADFIQDGDLERHIQKTRSIYNIRRQALVRAIALNFGKKVTISRENSGTHLLLKFHLPVSDERIFELATLHKLTLISTKSVHFDGISIPGEFLWSFINISEQTIGRSVSAFAKAMKELHA